MLSVDDLTVLIGQRFDPPAIEKVVGAKGRELPSDHDEGHPEDESHYFVFSDLGLEVFAGPDRIISSIICLLN